jgi:hypothetical protein
LTVDVVLFLEVELVSQLYVELLVEQVLVLGSEVVASCLASVLGELLKNCINIQNY